MAHGKTLQHTAMHCNTHTDPDADNINGSLKHTLQHTLQHTVTHCNTLTDLDADNINASFQHTATHCNTLQHTHRPGRRQHQWLSTSWDIGDSFRSSFLKAIVFKRGKWADALCARFQNPIIFHLCVHDYLGSFWNRDAVWFKNACAHIKYP